MGGGEGGRGESGEVGTPISFTCRGGTLRIGYIAGVGGVAVFQFVPGAQYHFTIPGSEIIPVLDAPSATC
jgi:hypothetical protein